MRELIDKYLRGTISEDERATLEGILARYGYQLDDIPTEEDDSYAPDVHSSARMRANILHANSARKYPKNTIWRWSLHIAASLIALFTIAYLLNNSQKQNNDDVWLVTENPGTGILKITLSDSSKIWLNARSKIAYPKNYNQVARQLRLTGEAYFDVKRDTLKPFTVFADSLAIEVLGTSFVVTNYPEERKRSVAVVSGRVQSYIKGNSQPAQVLHPGDQFGYLVDNKEVIRGHVDDVDELHAWREGTLVFRDEALETVTSALSRRYQVDFTFTDEQVKKKSITIKIRNEPLTTVMKVLQAVSDISYEIDGNQIHIQ
ncbi:FecR family protein [Sphingobacterium haloxyli]|uniref:Iron dicitrate transport regulator FecR n=1 Tax=Sphingobacterium haloxyli TaxID=2100533 RepID=A0A2S9IYB4_9SPHI|nr:FecR family protein [Sphingobacterium haloxyli]PRD45524.1 hypothetical protein C5745_18215 [Sphingobacterium haloxyli]